MPRAKKPPRGELTYTAKQKEYIQATNDSSIVSKCSADQAYSSSAHRSFFTPFVPHENMRRRSPIINRGYWLRMQCVEQVVRCFLGEPTPPGARKVVVNLGCGYDPLPFQFLSQGFKQNILYIDIDYPGLISLKAEKVATDSHFTSLLSNIQVGVNPKDGPQVWLRSDEYLAVGCDLEQLGWLNSLFENECILDCEILFTAEVSITYMRTDAANALIRWAGGLRNAKFSLLEQIIPDGPDHPFSKTMLKHFELLKTPLQSVRKYPTLKAQISRFVSSGWKNVGACDLLAFWANKIAKEVKEYIWGCEEFDEWEEFYLFAQHYCLLLAGNSVLNNESGPAFLKLVTTPYETVENSQLPLENASRRSFEKALHSTDEGFQVKVISTLPEEFRNRFGAGDVIDNGSMLYHGGLTSSGRTCECIKVTLTGVYTYNNLNNLPQARMCHTVNKIGDNALLLFGGRTSPRGILGDTWVFDSKGWQLSENEGKGFYPEPRYRHCAVSNEAQKQVLIFGGIGKGNRLLRDWYVFDLEKQKWLQPSMGSIPEIPSPRFAASMCSIARNTALLTGGIGADGTVLDDVWKITWTEFTVFAEQIPVCPEWRRLVCRYGSQIIAVKGSSEVLLIGGVSGGHLMPSSEAIVRISIGGGLFRVTGNSGLTDIPPPLLVGHKASLLGNAMVLAGGGAVCFSFGAQWNTSIYVISWHTVKPKDATPKQSNTLINPPNWPRCSTPGPTPRPILSGTRQLVSKTIPRVRITTEEDFAVLMAKGEPAILEGAYFGDCVARWDWNYLKEKVGVDKSIIVHSSNTPQMSFTTKNFSYEKTTFGLFIDTISASTAGPTCFSSSSLQQPGLYLRSLSSSSPTKTPTNLVSDFPNLSSDFFLPPELAFVQKNFHSSPLRISSANVGMWLHFDVTANILFHVRGTKRFRLWHPNRALELGFPPGGSSSATILDPFADLRNTTTTTKAGTQPMNFESTQPDYDITLSPGSALYIPPVFPHAALPVTACVAVNVFFRDLSPQKYALGKDVYGNRDLVAYERGRQTLGRLVKEFDGLPSWVRRFYLERLGQEILDAARVGEDVDELSSLHF